MKSAGLLSAEGETSKSATIEWKQLVSFSINFDPCNAERLRRVA